MNKLPMTTVGYSVLENELKHRIQIDRPRLIERIQEAIADDSNLAENTEYQAAKTEQEINEARIAELEDKHARADEIWSRRSEQEMFDCLAWLYDGFALPHSHA
jgi:transcription elongation factor GreA